MINLAGSGGTYPMISPDNRRYAYGKAQLIEVICQLRFPTILSIDTREPADFQETVIIFEFFLFS